LNIHFYKPPCRVVETFPQVRGGHYFLL